MLPLPLSFPLTLRGYDRTLVDEYLDELHAEIRILTIDRDAALHQAETLADLLEQVRAERAALQARFDTVCRTPADPNAVSARVHRILDLASAEAAEILDTARRQADAVNAQADRARNRILAEARSIAERQLGQAQDRIRQLEEIRARTITQLQAADRALAGAERILANEQSPPARPQAPARPSAPSRARTAA
ncbi:hypothetical protein FNH06_00405 [Amycolatopsis acidiphila]|uniref:DivIVA domain-containing protein n=1 Tax=Amycolatopsis acidiphila TaxID=715473 RepID=A0A558APB0_9PSEU|nr:hypothetical protein FNH06_00405 [Amycolatopsis acidiphila]